MEVATASRPLLSQSPTSKELVCIRLPLILLAIAVPAVQADESYWQQKGCPHGHGLKPALRGANTILRSAEPLTRRRGAHAWHFARCTNTEAQARQVGRHVRRLTAWRRSYSGYWTIQAKRIPPYMVATLARLRGCETRGIPYPANYRYSGHHHGAYQYLASTWARAQATWPAKHRTTYAYQASPAHQDAVTARFFPAHRGEWACSA